MSNQPGQTNAAAFVRWFRDSSPYINAFRGRVFVISFGGEMLSANDLDRLASMPTRDQAISMLMALMKAPVEKLVRTMNEVPGKLTRTVAAIRDQKQA